jgi:uncharacterized protein YndB with AHSA1/START domain
MSCSVSATAVTTAPRKIVFSVLAETEGYPAWSDFNEASLEREGHDERQGVGAIRRLRSGRFRPSTEEVVAFEPDEHLSYVLLDGLPLRDYRADVTLTETVGGGTTLRWASRFRPARRGTGWMYRVLLALALRRLVRDLAREAERQAAAMTAPKGQSGPS